MRGGRTVRQPDQPAVLDSRFPALGRRPDDYTKITPLTEAGQTIVDMEGIIGDRRDTDTFSFEVIDRATRVTLEITPWPNGPNLDIAASLFGQSIWSTFCCCRNTSVHTLFRSPAATSHKSSIHGRNQREAELSIRRYNRSITNRGRAQDGQYDPLRVICCAYNRELYSFRSNPDDHRR